MGTEQSMHGHRAVCRGILVGGLLDDLVIEVEAVAESRAEN